jgi:putative flippase GtrA
MPNVNRIVSFGLVSGVGLALDFVVFTIGLNLALSVFAANLAGATCAVAFVYFASVRRVFDYEGRFLLELLAVYIAYQTCGVTLASIGVNLLVKLHVPAIAAKVAILPVTFSANYLFMSFLTRRKRSILR